MIWALHNDLGQLNMGLLYRPSQSRIRRALLYLIFPGRAYGLYAC